VIKLSKLKKSIVKGFKRRSIPIKPSAVIPQEVDYRSLWVKTTEAFDVDISSSVVNEFI
jgi:hypothetical protein